MPLRPLNDTLIIEQDDNQFNDANAEVVRIAREGIIKLPEVNSLEKMADTGTIISWGDGCKQKSLFKIGMKVMFKPFGGHAFYHEGKRLRSFVEEEILAIYD